MASDVLMGGNSTIELYATMTPSAVAGPECFAFRGTRMGVWTGLRRQELQRVWFLWTDVTKTCSRPPRVCGCGDFPVPLFPGNVFVSIRWLTVGYCRYLRAEGAENTNSAPPWALTFGLPSRSGGQSKTKTDISYRIVASNLLRAVDHLFNRTLHPFTDHLLPPQDPTKDLPKASLDCHTSKRQINNAALQLQINTTTVHPLKNLLGMIYPVPYIGNGINTKKIKHNTADTIFADKLAIASSF
ncbi:hypothetical protein BDZ45DRAFT_749592 [Acephala macrosclerotiorum]|nr:hypothetical protein BDZ45DRAFT_749592 [Acephala macrosclerotiorum]